MGSRPGMRECFVETLGAESGERAKINQREIFGTLCDMNRSSIQHYKRMQKYLVMRLP